MPVSVNHNTVQISYSPYKYFSRPPPTVPHTCTEFDLVDPATAPQEPLFRNIVAKKVGSTVKTTPARRDREKFQQLLSEAHSAQQHNSQPLTNIRNQSTRSIQYSGHDVETWYTSPYPINSQHIFICRCLRYFASRHVLFRHSLKCDAAVPHEAGLIYDDKERQVYEVDGIVSRLWCQRLCLLGKLFLGSKTLFWDVECFTFYVLVVNKEIRGYFSKEKTGSYNLSCIVTLPIYQRSGSGAFLIDFSYLLSRTEGKCGSPEKPLSDLGLLSYRNYWRFAVARFLLENKTRRSISVKEISERTGMSLTDVVVGLELSQSLYVSGHHYAVRPNLGYIQKIVEQWQKPVAVSKFLVWKPLVLGPSGGVNVSCELSLIGNVKRVLCDTTGKKEYADCDVGETRDDWELSFPISTVSSATAELVSEQSESEECSLGEASEEEQVLGPRARRSLRIRKSVTLRQPRRLRSRI